MNKFSIEYPEYHIAEELQKIFPKNGKYSVSIPMSRQQKYYDLILHNANNKRCITIQVKSSRTYIKNKSESSKEYNFYAWLNTFIVNEFTDLYFIYISYPIFDEITFSPKADLGTKILVFRQDEMKEIIQAIKTKSGKPDKFFGFGFNIKDDGIYGTRGFDTKEDFSKYIFNNRIMLIKEIVNNQLT